MKSLLLFALTVSSVDAFVLPQLRSNVLHRTATRSPIGGKKHVPSSTTTTQLHFFLFHPGAKWGAQHLLGGLLPVGIVKDATETWYRRIDLPSWTPPDRVFGPVWTMLYCSMGVAAQRIAAATSSTTWLMTLWWFHLALNYLWAPVFFGMQRLRLGLVINLVLLATLAVIIPLFYQVNALSGLLLIPYMAWVIFATVLNWAICKRNPTSGGYNEAMIQAKIMKMQKDIV